MKKSILLVFIGVFIAGCNTTPNSHISTRLEDVKTLPSKSAQKESTKKSQKGKTSSRKRSSKKCSIRGNYNWKSSNKNLTYNLCKLSRVYETVNVTPNGSCRVKSSTAKNSYHLYRQGCKAADIWIKGVSGHKILRWWGKNVGGGRGFYRCRRFVHVDVGPSRTWHWKTSCAFRRK